MTKKTTMFAAGIAVVAFAVGFYVFDNTSGDTAAAAASTNTEVTTGTTTDNTVVAPEITTENVNANTAPAAVPAVTDENQVDTLDATE